MHSLYLVELWALHQAAVKVVGLALTTVRSTNESLCFALINRLIQTGSFVVGLQIEICHLVTPDVCKEFK